MKVNKTLLITVLVIVLMLGVSVASFEAGVRYANMQARIIQSEFFNDRGGQPGTQQIAPSQRGQGVRVVGGPMQMLHEMLGIGQ